MVIKLGVIGIGGIGKEHIRRCSTLINGSQVVAVNDINQQQAADHLKEIGLAAKLYTDPLALINAPDVDAIIVTSSGPSHEEYVLAAIAAGKKVFCEKPLAVTADGCKKIVEAEMKFGKRLVQVGFMRAYDESFIKLKEVLDGGKLGYPLIVKCVHHNPTVDSAYTTSMAVTDSMVHEIDNMRWLLNDDYVSVQIIFPRRTRSAHAGVRDPQVMLLTTKQGILITVEMYVHCHYGYDIRCEVVCEDGIAYLPSPIQVETRFAGQLAQPVTDSWIQRFLVAYDVELQAFIDGALADKLTGPSAWDGYIAALTCDAAIVAQNTNGVVPLDLPVCPEFYKS